MLTLFTFTYTVCIGKHKILCLNYAKYIMQGKLVPKLTLGPFLTLIRLEMLEMGQVLVLELMSPAII